MDSTFQLAEVAVDTATDTPESYLTRLQSLGITAWTLESTKPDTTKVFYTDDSCQYQIDSPAGLIEQVSKLEESRSTSICVIENISAEWVAKLGAAWDIDPNFFATHADNCPQDELWRARLDFDWKGDPLNRTDEAVRPSFLGGPIEYVEGIFQYHNAIGLLLPSAKDGLVKVPPPNHVRRHYFKDGKWPVQSNTRISYCRPNIHMCFLNQSSNKLPTLRFPYAINTGGLELQRLLFDSQKNYSVYEALKIFCQHSWHHKLLFDLRRRRGIDERRIVIPGPAFIYLLASCLWEENLRYLDKEIKHISFREIRNPKLDINNVLHDRREDLARLKSELVKTAMHVPSGVEEYFRAYWSNGAYYSRITPGVSEHLKRLEGDTSKLEAFLMETFTLFMSSISVQDTRMSMDQAQRGSRLTILAFIYVPLSFVTGVFGMNVHQINGSGLNIWVCFVVLVAVLFLTMPVFWIMKLHGDRKATNDSKV